MIKVDSELKRVSDYGLIKFLDEMDPGKGVEVEDPFIEYAFYVEEIPIFVKRNAYYVELENTKALPFIKTQYYKNKFGFGKMGFQAYVKSLSKK